MKLFPRNASQNKGKRIRPKWLAATKVGLNS